MKQSMRYGLWAALIVPMTAFLGPRAGDAAIAAVDGRYVHAGTFQKFQTDLQLRLQADSINRAHLEALLLERFGRVDADNARIRACIRHRGSCE